MVFPFFIKFAKKNTTMNTITIKSNKPEDIYLLDELARRLNLETEIDTKDYTGIAKQKPVQNDKDSKESILEDLRTAFREVKLAKEGKIKLKTLEDLLDEYKD
ncbi:MAG: hypothetical protein B6D61_11530 [Bacteroidetes bacterium 4484_249]|nr:MAG: hypothetical protein B6D61_11530 [Bacteroidetes bacterium 4484_249]